MGGLKVLRYKSDILKDQLGSHLKQLEQSGFLASWHMEKAQTREGFVLSFRPGDTFFADYDRFYRNRNQGELQWNFHADRRQISEPLKVARLFQEKLSGKAADALAFVSPKNVETAKYILDQIEFADVPAFIDYALAAARKTRFDVRSLGGVRQYLAAYVEKRTHNVAAKVAASARAVKEQEEADVRSYERFCRSSTEALFASLPLKEKAVIEQCARAKAPKFAAKGSLANTMYEIEKIRITRERHASKLPTFGQWKGSRSS
jgi:hypothetical protein